MFLSTLSAQSPLLSLGLLSPPCHLSDMEQIKCTEMIIHTSAVDKFEMSFFLNFPVSNLNCCS